MGKTSKNTGKNTGKPGRIENLIPWVPGQSGNPDGRPPDESSVRWQIRQVAKETHPKDPKRRKKARLLADKIFELGMSGQIEAIKTFIKEGEGNLPQSIVGPDGGPLNVNVTNIQVLNQVEKMTPEQRQQRLLQLQRNADEKSK